MADVQPFRAVRYSGAAGAPADLVAPPYDAVSADERAQLYTRSPYNVVHVTLPESADEAGRTYRDWLADGILERDDEPSVWLAVEEFVGPDGVARERHGVDRLAGGDSVRGGRRAAARAHASAHPRGEEAVAATRPASSRSRSSCSRIRSSTCPFPVRRPRSRWTARDCGGCQPRDAEGLGDAQLLIADGHHRYESAVELADELATDVRIMALVVPTEDAGLQLFPTHRVFSSRPDVASGGDVEPCADLDEALARLESESYDRAAVVRYRRGGVEIVHGDEGELDVELVDRHGLDGIRYTPRLDEALAAVDGGAADAAFVLRRPRVEDVFASARRGERMPPKSTYFFPKPLSGLLFHPIDRVTPWLDTCRLCVADIRDVLERLPTRAEREPVLQLGQGGDDTTAIDQAAEDAVVARLAATGEDFVLVSEELGERTFGSGGPRRVVVDPIDGSVNAKRGIPFFSLSLAVAEGPTMGDVVFGYVYDFGSGEEWTAERGKGAFLDGASARRSAAQGRDRDPLVRGNDHRGDRRANRGGPWSRCACACHGVSRVVPLPPRGRSCRRRRLAQGRALGGHRRSAAPRA